MRDAGGTGFWHEAYFMRGGAEAIYDDISKPLGFATFAPQQTARGAMFSSRRRAGREDPQVAPPVIAEEELYTPSSS